MFSPQMVVSNEYRQISPSLPSTEEVIAICHARAWDCNGFTYPSNASSIAYIKYLSVTMDGVQTQRYVHSALEQMMDASGSGYEGTRNPPCIRVERPDLYGYGTCRWRHRGSTAARFLIEKRHLMYDQVAKAFNQLLQIPAPSGQCPGPVVDGLIRHWFFNDQEAHAEYGSIDELKRHINKVYY